MECYERSLRLHLEIHTLYPKLRVIDLAIFSDLCQNQPASTRAIADRIEKAHSLVNGVVSKLCRLLLVVKNGHGLIVTSKGERLRNRIIYFLSRETPPKAAMGVCPACGHSRFLTRHHYLPQCVFGNGNPHTVPLCGECHDDLERIIKKLKPKDRAEYLKVSFEFILDRQRHWPDKPAST